jgi:hypothetical protein
MALLRDLQSFGDIDGEEDFRPEYFLPSDTWDQVKAGARPIVLGRKGTGKTALKRALLAETVVDPSLQATALDFSDYPWGLHHAISDETRGPKSRYLETWLFLSLVELAKLVLRDEDADFAGREPVAKALRKFIEANWGSIDFDYRKTFGGSGLKMGGRLEPTALGFKVGHLEWTHVERENWGNRLGQVNQFLRDCIERLARIDARYFLVFDELDLDFDPTSADYTDSLVGLIRACQSLHKWAEESGTAAHVVALLRDDVYAELRFADKNKITTDLATTIRWNRGLEGPNSLKALVDARVTAVLGTAKDDPWASAFCDQEVSARAMFEYIVERTHLRPRDMIQFCNEALAAARLRIARKPDTDDCITGEDVLDASHAYSLWLRAELADEIYAHFPEWEQWLEILRRLGQPVFSADDFTAACANAEEFAHGVDVKALAAMHRFSIVGFQRPEGEGVPVRTYWGAESPEVPFNPHAPQFVVHPGLRAALDLDG